MAERILEGARPLASRQLGRPRPPQPRGPLSAHVLEHLLQDPHPVPPAPPAGDDALWGDDAQLALYCCYELHYRCFSGVDEGWEWEPSLLALRRDLETAFERRLEDEVGAVCSSGDVEDDLRRTIAAGKGPSLSAYLEERGTLETMREFSIHRSAYQLKEADPHTWAIPRLGGAPKAALIEIQLDEYGEGVEPAMHSTLFARSMEALGLDSTYGAYLDCLPGTTLATTNVISLFGLHRRRRGALIGHLAAFEATSVTPMTRYRNALRRLGLGPDAQSFYEVHVTADAHHEVVALEDMASGLARAEPDLGDDIVFGARAMMLVEERFARHLIESWDGGRSSLLPGERI